MIVGTAGHIDHGKTTLVRALTGVDTDRLQEEKARGISIELGYAYTPLGNGEILGFVDVPGHQRLVHTMAAGACGIDFVLLVIAADDGVMPQTREHVAILQLFGVTRGVIALTKVDRVDAARAAAAEAEIRAFLSGTVFADAPVFRIDASADGDAGTLGGLKAYLADTAAAFRRGARSNRTAAAAGIAGPAGSGPISPDARLFRLAVDRVFTLAGHGTVVAGTVFSGNVRVGDNVMVFPSKIAVRVRSIHSQNRPAEIGYSGERCALNLTGIDKNALKRGDWIADPRALEPTTRIDVRIQLLTDTTTVLKPWSPVHFHHGAAHSTAHVVPLEDSTISSGQSGYAQIVFDTPVCALPGDRFIVRDAQAIHTHGGGVVLDPFATSRKRRSSERIRYLRALERMSDGAGVTALLAETPYGIKQSDMVRLTGQALEKITLPAEVTTVEGARGRYLLLASAWRSLRDEAVNTLRRYHTESADEPGPDIGRLRRMAMPQLTDDLWRPLVAELISERVILRAGPWIYLPGHAVTLSDGEKILARKLQPLIAAGRFNPPWVRDLANALNEAEDTVRRVLRKQVTRGDVYQVVNDLFYDRRCIDELAIVVTTLAKEHGTIEAAQYRDAVGLGRKRAIQILEFFDRVGHTRRIHDTRTVRADSGWGNA